MSKSPIAELSDAQLVILSTAAQRADGSLLPFPQSLTVKGPALTKSVGTLCKREQAKRAAFLIFGVAFVGQRRDTDVLDINIPT